MFGYDEIGFVALRMTIIFAIGLIVVRLMGNRAVGQLSPFDFVLMVGIGDIVANVAMEGNQALLPGAEGLVAILFLQQLLSRLSLKSVTLRKWFEGVPVTLIENGEIMKQNLIKSNFNYDDLRQELHKEGLDIPHIKDIHIARLESSGDFSVILNDDAEPLMRRDFENFFTTNYDNPLSPVGRKLQQLEKFMEDMHIIAEEIRSGRTSNRCDNGHENRATSADDKIH